jgi:hypothetical protein
MTYLPRARDKAWTAFSEPDAKQSEQELPSKKMVKIKKSYKFAGEVVT